MFLKFFKVYFPWEASRLLKEKKRQYPHPFFPRVIKIYGIKSPFSFLHLILMPSHSHERQILTYSVLSRCCCGQIFNMEIMYLITWMHQWTLENCMPRMWSLAFMYVWHETHTHNHTYAHTTCVKYVDIISVTYDRCK